MRNHSGRLLSRPLGVSTLPCGRLSASGSGQYLHLFPVEGINGLVHALTHFLYALLPLVLIVALQLLEAGVFSVDDAAQPLNKIFLLCFAY